jgi:hypothetical protein
MKSFIYKNLFFPLISLLVFLPGAILAAAAPDYGLGATGGAAGYNKAVATPDIIVGKIIRAVLVLVGVIFLVLIIYAGFLWNTAGGNEEQVKKAKKLISTSVIGLIIVLAGGIISGYVLDKIVPFFIK